METFSFEIVGILIGLASSMAWLRVGGARASLACERWRWHDERARGPIADTADAALTIALACLGPCADPWWTRPQAVQRVSLMGAAVTAVLTIVDASRVLAGDVAVVMIGLFCLAASYADRQHHAFLHELQSALPDVHAECLYRRAEGASLAEIGVAVGRTPREVADILHNAMLWLYGPR